MYSEQGDSKLPQNIITNTLKMSWVKIQSMSSLLSNSARTFLSFWHYSVCV